LSKRSRLTDKWCVLFSVVGEEHDIQQNKVLN
jgi:hypothetical protein